MVLWIDNSDGWIDNSDGWAELTNSVSITESICVIEEIGSYYKEISISESSVITDVVSVSNEVFITDSTTGTEAISIEIGIVLDPDAGNMEAGAPESGIATGSILEGEVGEMTNDGLVADILMGATVIQIKKSYPRFLWEGC